MKFKKRLVKKKSINQNLSNYMKKVKKKIIRISDKKR